MIFRDKPRGKDIIIISLSLTPLFLIAIVLLLAATGVIPGKVHPLAFPIIFIFLLFVLWVTDSNYRKVVIKPSGKVVVPSFSGSHFFDNEWAVFWKANHRKYPVFCFNLNNINNVFITKEIERGDQESFFYATNPEKTVCIEFKESLHLRKGFVGIQRMFNMEDRQINKIYVSVLNPEKLVIELSKLLKNN